MPGRTVLLDTSFVVALENRDDPLHATARQLDQELLQENAVLLLHWGILLEIGDGYARLGRRSKGIELLARFEQEQGYEVYPLTDDVMRQAATLYRSRRDKEWGLTDCVSFALMRELQVTHALTADVHFRQAGFVAMLLD